MSGFSFSQQVRPHPEVLVQDTQGEMLLLHLTAEKYVGLDTTAACMFRELCAGPTIAAACARLQTIYDVDEPTLRTDLQGLLQQLLAEELICVSGD